jgi:hypothetical protein
MSYGAMNKQFLQASLKLAAAVLLFILPAPPTALRASDVDAFGSKESSPGTLIATFYDIKQTQERKPTNISNDLYAKVVCEFLENDWDESILNRYFRVTQSLYATQIYFPGMPSSVAPKAFGVEKIVEGERWLAHYKGQVSPPETGRYRFASYFDAWLTVAVNGRTVLVAPRDDIKITISSFKSTPDRIGQKLISGDLIYGDWMDLKKGVPLDIDIAFGDRGGSFTGVLLVQKEGETYEKTEKGFPILPLFQLMEKKTVAPKSRSGTPAFCLGKPWTGIP